jgi:enamine deaminase RidA (YjgF/YER057c/UK114 family)
VTVIALSKLRSDAGCCVADRTLAGFACPLRPRMAKREATQPSEASLAKVEQRLQALGLVLPAALQLPPGAVLPFPWVRVIGPRALISGHGPTNADGSLAQPLGKVGAEVTVAQGYAAARLTGLAILASLKRELGDLDRIGSWVRVFGMVNSAPGFNRQPAVINGFSDLIVELFGAEAGAHARSAVGMAELPFNIPVEVEGEVSLVER